MAIFSPSTTSLTNPYKFRVHLSNAGNTGNGAFAKVSYNVKDFDTGSNFDAVTNFNFTAPAAGFYQFNAHCETSGTPTLLIISLFKNGSEYSRGGDIRGVTATVQGVVVTDTVQLAANDTIDVRVFGSSAVALDTSSYSNYFSGFLVSLT